MLFRLAWGNVRRAGRDYLVYLVTLALGVTVFYAFNTIAEQAAAAGLPASVSVGLSRIISGLTVFLACVLGFLMVYANNYIMRRRKQQFGLYQVLGMGRGRVAVIMSLETALVSVAALTVGLVCGIALSQLMTFFTASLFRTQISSFHFFVSGDAALLTLACLGVIFLVTLAFNLRVVARSRVIDLMGARRANEAVAVRNPWFSAVLFVLGVALVGVAYARLLHDGLPIGASVSNDRGYAFLATTLMVVAGTVLLFFGLSGALLKALQAARRLWWRGLNMFTLRQLAAKVNTVSMSMAVISLILFLALTSVTTGMSIANVMNESVERGTPADYTVQVSYYAPSVMPRVRESVAQGTALETAEEVERISSTTQPVDVMTVASGAKRSRGDSVDLASIAGRHVQTDVYDAMPEEGAEPLVSMAGLAKAAGAAMPKFAGTGDERDTSLGLMSESDYNRYLAFRGKPQVSLGKDGYLITADAGPAVTEIYDAALSKGVTIDLGGATLRPATERVDADASTFSDGSMGSNLGTVVVPDDVLSGLGLSVLHSYLLLDYAPESADAGIDRQLTDSRVYGTVDDTSGNEVGYFGIEATRSYVYESADSTNGFISYLAIYIGFVLVVACGAILTIQQLSGVSDAAPSYRLLAELGADGSSLRRSLLAQQGVFFAFPLVVGIAHSVVALRVVVDVVETLGGLTIGGAAGLACAIFVACYGGYFALTYTMGCGLVRGAVRVR